MDSPNAYIPMDRRKAMVAGKDLASHTTGAALFADISGFTPLTEALVRELGARRAAEELTKSLNLVFGDLIDWVHRYGGSVVSFAGDAITCWFDDRLLLDSFWSKAGQPGSASLFAIACAQRLQQVMGRFSTLETRSGSVVSLSIKIAVSAGPVRRFLAGDPQVQLIDVLAGATLDRMARAEQLASKSEIVVCPEAMSVLGDRARVVEWRQDADSGQRFAVIAGLQDPPQPATLPARESQEELVLPEEKVRSWLLPPVYERLRTGQARFLAEMRPGVALFLKFGGLDYDHDDAASHKLDRYIRWVQNVLARYEGYMLQLITGDKGSYLYASFGAPLAHDDDPPRAVAAAMELLSAPPELDYITRVQIGISQGQMRVGAYGGAARQTYGVLSDEVTTAARLMGKAEPGQVLVSQRIADAAARHYQFVSLGTVTLKGKEKPLPVYRPLARRLVSPQRPATIFTNPLVGRDDELAQMNGLLDATRAEQGHILCLQGMAGVGKSHLTAEFVELAAARDYQVVLGACQSTSQGIAYTPWRQAFRALFGLSDEPGSGSETRPSNEQQVARVEAVLNRTNPGWQLRLPLLGDLLGLPIADNETTAAFSPQLRQESLFALAVDIVQTWARGRPLLVVIEDVHWMDEASLGLATALGRAIASLPAVLLLVQRPPIQSGGRFVPELERLPCYHHIDLDVLSPSGVEALASDRLQGRLSSLALSLILAQAHGNPFFTEELVFTLRESGRLVQDDGLWVLSEPMLTALREANCLTRQNGEWTLAPDAQLSAAHLGIPDSIHGIVLSRVDRLPEEHKLTLKVASVIGRTFELALLVKSHPLDPGLEALREQIEVLQRREFARLETPQPQQVYLFKHNITQEVVYQMLLEDQQRELHQAVGDALEQLLPDAVEQLAYHYSHSDLRDKSLLYLDKAAQKTQREYANETALNYYNQALVLEERWPWRRGQVQVLHILGRREQEQIGLEMLEKASDAPLFEVAYLWGQYHEALGNYAQAQAAVRQAMAACEQCRDQIGRVRCLAQLGQIARRQADYAQATREYDRALVLLQDRETYSDEKAQALIQVFNGLAGVHREQGDYEQVKAYCQRALELSRKAGNRLGEVEALNTLGGMALYRRNFVEAQRYDRQALEIRRAIGDRAGEGMSLNNLAFSAVEAGDYGQAEIYFSDVLSIQQATGNRYEKVNVWNNLGVLYQELGDLSRAQNCLEQGLQLAKEIGAENEQTYLLGNLGLVVRDQGDLKAAELLFAEGLDLAQAQAAKSLAAHFFSYLGTVSRMAGRFGQAIERAGAALTMRKDEAQPLWTTVDLATLAAAHLASGNKSQAEDYAQQALGILDECRGQGPEFPQRDYFVCYQVLTALGQIERAQAALGSAYALVMTRADKIADVSLRQSFLERVPINREIIQEANLTGLDQTCQV